MEKRIIDLEIVDDLENSGVDGIALVDSPAIEKNFMYFSAEQFVEPNSGESESDYMGRCISNAIGEGYEQDQAVAMCISKWESHSAMDFAKISFDFDDTLSTAAGLELAKKYKDEGNTLYIISARNEVSQGMLDRASELGIPESRVHATGSNKAKVEEVKKLGITKHVDNNADVISELGGIGQKFEINTSGLAPYINETGVPLKKKAVNMAKMMFADEDKMELVGPVAVPDMEIPRKGKDNDVYFVRFSKEVVRKMAEKFMREQRLADNNIQHKDEVNAGSYVFESWITETLEDKANTVYNLDVPVGTWMIKMRVTNPETWAKVKSGDLKGFSLQGNFLSQEEYDAYVQDKKMYEDLVKLVSSL